MHSRSLAIVAASFGAAIVLMSAARLGAVVLATPSSIWLDEYPRLADPGRLVSAKTLGFADSLVNLVNDPMPVTVRVSACAQVPGQPVVQDAALATCLAVLDTGTRASPALGELWAYKADVLARAGRFGADMQEALRRSYEAGAHEGWIAAGRVVLGLRLFPLLAGDLQGHVLDDLHLVLQSEALSGPVIDEYAHNPAIRGPRLLPCTGFRRATSRPLSAALGRLWRDRRSTIMKRFGVMEGRFPGSAGTAVAKGSCPALAAGAASAVGASRVR